MNIYIKRLMNFSKKRLPDLPEKKNRPSETYSYSLICFMIVFVIIIIGVIALNINTAKVTLSMHFPEISESHNPDGSSFDVYEIMSDEVLVKASEKLGGKIDADTLKKHLSVAGSTSSNDFGKIEQNVLDGNDLYAYFPDRYTITYSTVSDTIAKEGFTALAAAVFKQITYPSKRTILKAVSEAYCEYYNSSYISADGFLTAEWAELEKLDYFNRADEFSNVIARMNGYIMKCYDEDTAFETSDGVSFGDLNAELDNILKMDVDKYKSFVIQNGITYNRDKLLKQMQYVSVESRDEYDRGMAEYAIMLDGIGLYDPNVTKVVFVPSVDAEEKFYMNRTKIGIDYLTKRAESVRLSAEESLNRAQQYDYLINRFTATAEPDEGIIEKANKMSDTIIEKLKDFSKRALEVNEEYLKKETFKGINTTDVVYGQGLLSSAILVVKTTVIWSALCYFAYYIYCFLKRKCVKEASLGWKGTDTDVIK